MSNGTHWLEKMVSKKRGEKLSVGELACALYEGHPNVSNLAETLARNYGQAGALSFFDLMGPEVQNFWFGIAKQLIDHAKEWEKNKGSACCLSIREQKRLRELPRIELE